MKNVGFSSGSDSEEFPCNVGFNLWVGKVPLPGESPWTGIWQAILWGHKKSDTTERLSTVTNSDVKE